MVRDRGFRNVVTRECEGRTYTFTARRNGNSILLYVIRGTAMSGAANRLAHSDPAEDLQSRGKLNKLGREACNWKLRVPQIPTHCLEPHSFVRVDKGDDHHADFFGMILGSLLTIAVVYVLIPWRHRRRHRHNRQHSRAIVNWICRKRVGTGQRSVRTTG